MAKPTDQQQEIDFLREELRLLKHAHEAAQKELDALRSGKVERQRIAEGAEISAADRDQWKAQYEALAAKYADSVLLLDYHDQNIAPPRDLLNRVRSQRAGTQLQTGVPAKSVQG